MDAVALRAIRRSPTVGPSSEHICTYIRGCRTEWTGAGGWTVGSSRVSALEDRLTALEATAPDDAGRTRARTLRDAVRTARTRLHGLLTTGQVDTFQRDLDALAAELERALETPQPAW
jgi:hypothetical protein